MPVLRGYLAAPGFEVELEKELGASIEARINGLLLAPAVEPEPAWVANIWFDPVRIPIASIGDAANRLRAIQRNWALHPGANFRRAQLISERLPRVAAKPIVFGESPPSSPLGSWTLIDADTMLVAPRCSSPFPNGVYRFVENREAPPSRAYLKLWEALTRAGAMPTPGELCLDLGASPGGWTWVVASLGARVVSVDKAPLDPNIASLPTVEVLRESAFGIEPASFPDAAWVLSDIICYPSRLLRLVRRWLEAGSTARFVCTLKFQGATDFEAIAGFNEIPGSRLVHLHHNKHELTWLRL